MNTGPVRIIHGDKDGIVVEGIFKTKTKTD